MKFNFATLFALHKSSEVKNEKKRGDKEEKKTGIIKSYFKMHEAPG